jgi:hypothetical protein
MAVNRDEATEETMMSFDAVDIAIRMLFWLAVLVVCLHPAPLDWARSLVPHRRTPVAV